MRKNKLLLLLALLLTAATGAWAQEPATTYSVKMKGGTQDAKNWSIASGEKSATGDAADGLTGLSEGDAVTLTYTGRLKVKGVKATSDAAAASVPDGALSGVFSVSATKKVYFSKGNLRYASGAWSFFDNQYDYYTSHSADAWDHFGWSTSATTYGMSTSTSNSTYSGDFVDWGSNSDLQTALGTGWFTLSKDEWTYLFNTRTVNGGTGSDHSYTLGQEVNDVPGVVLYPDGYTGEVYSGSNWATFEAAGCVFLPAAGYRDETSVSTDSNSSYWSSTVDNTGTAYCVDFYSGYVDPASNYGRSFGCSVRLVREGGSAEPAVTWNTVDLSTLTADYEAQDHDKLINTLSKKVKISIADGATVMLDGAVINGANNDSYSWAGLNCLGNATIVLKDGSENTVKGFYENYPGIHVPAGSKLTIQGGTEGTGKLTASPFDGGTVDSYGAGIGGGYDIPSGDISIEGGTVTATGGMYAAGIGGGDATCGNISITGGTVTAMGGSQGAGIGSGSGASCGNITIANTVTKVTATKGSDGANSIGAGFGGTCGTVTIGGTKYWENNAAVNGGDTYLAQATIEYPAAEATPALSITSPSVGQVIGSDGKNYAYGSLPTGVTAVAKICYVSGSNGLALALTDEEGKMNWSTAQTTCAAHTAPFTGGTWKLATKDEWDGMINAAGSYSALRDGFSSVGGANMQSDDYYWSSTEDGSSFAWYYDDYDQEDWDYGDKEYELYVRACLAF